MQWITREQVRVGRTGCAWLIKRFVDPRAEFLFVPSAQALSEASRLGATPFHVEGAELAARGDESSFEVVMDRYSLTNDPALALLGKIVNTADVKGSQAQRLEGPGLKAITEGILALYPTDAARIQAGGAVFDALYAYCQQVIARGAA